MKNDFPFLPDDAILERIGFAFSCFDTFTVFMEIPVDSEQYRESVCKFLLACLDELSAATPAEDYRRTGYENIYSLFHDCLRRRGESDQA